MIVWISLIAAALALASSSGVFAAPPNGVMGDLDVGACSRAEVREEIKGGPQVRGVYFSWAQGYMSALNTVSSGANQQVRDLAAKSAKDQTQHLQAFCDRHPLYAYREAVISLILAPPFARDTEPQR